MCGTPVLFRTRSLYSPTSVLPSTSSEAHVAGGPSTRGGMERMAKRRTKASPARHRRRPGLSTSRPSDPLDPRSNMRPVGERAGPVPAPERIPEGGPRKRSGGPASHVLDNAVIFKPSVGSGQVLIDAVPERVRAHGVPRYQVVVGELLQQDAVAVVVRDRVARDDIGLPVHDDRAGVGGPVAVEVEDVPRDRALVAHEKHALEPVPGDLVELDDERARRILHDEAYVVPL